MVHMIHDSHQAFFRNPFGAVPCGQEVTLRLKAPARGRAVLCLVKDGKGQEEIEMLPRQDGPGESVYEAVFFAPSFPGLLWYHFKGQWEGKTWYCGSSKAGRGGLSAAVPGDPIPYQITVYKKGAQTPSWFKDTLIYQIFPDRFCNGLPRGRTLKPKKNSFIHSHWSNTPYYVKDSATGDVVRWDFFGGNLLGVLKKLPYLRSLGVGTIYLNPIFEAPSNHRYDTSDYHKVDPMLGSNRLFSLLCCRAREMGISIILDGVFSHTGSDSIYFNKEGNYPGPGAYQSSGSPYYRWYCFEEHPEKYESWWGVKTLPNVNELEPSYQDFIFGGGKSVIRHWGRLGAAGWRLDVADELPIPFIRRLRKALKEIDEEFILLGEVWEDASNKISYGQRRSYLLGEELDSVMNYPFRNLLLDFLLGRQEARDVAWALVSLQENYPPEHFYSVMNLLGSHDRARILTLLGEGLPAEMFQEEKYWAARERLKLAVLWQMTFPGAPSIYYGDEVGLMGEEDPDNRRAYPWGREDKELLAFFREMAALRNHYDVLRTGDWVPLHAKDDVFFYTRNIHGGRDLFGRERKDNTALVLLNRSLTESREVKLDVSPWFIERALDVLEDYREISLDKGRLSVTLRPLEGKLLLKDRHGHNLFYRRECGVLLHPTSLPGPWGIGSLGREARAFVDFLAESGQNLWQVLPLNPPGYGESPYQCYSAFAGNDLLIDLEDLVSRGLLSPGGMKDEPSFGDDAVDFDKAREFKEELFRQAFEVFEEKGGDAGFKAFEGEAAYWLEDYALFMALKDHFGGVSWVHWQRDAALRDKEALAEYRRKLEPDIRYRKFLQYTFFRQWRDIKIYANRKGVKIVGDLPIFVAHDSSDVWVHPHLFKLDSRGFPTRLTGVPPDYFSDTGQLWGNPHYRWRELARDDYRWWRERFQTLSRLVDMIRIDHFRGFEACWEIPGGDKTAKRGRWVQGPGERFFRVIKKYLGDLSIIAEDLGVITPRVEELKQACGYPGMKVMQFVLEEKPEEEFRLPLAEKETVAYTGTHDNNTILGWYRDKYRGHKDLSALPEEEICWYFIERVYRSNARLVIIPLQDLLALDSSARMNTPGTSGGNWRWRFPEGSLTPAISVRLKALAHTHGFKTGPEI